MNNPFQGRKHCLLSNQVPPQMKVGRVVFGQYIKACTEIHILHN